MEQEALGRLPFVLERVKACWGRQEEIDIMAISEMLSSSECK